MAQRPGQYPAVPRWRINVLLLVILLASLVTSRQLVMVQGIGQYNGRALREKAQDELTKHVVLQPRRGTIYDRNGVALAMNVNKRSLYADPSRVSDPAKLAISLAPLLGEDPTKLQATLGKEGSHWARVKRWLEPEVADQIDALDQNTICSGTCLYLIDEAKREYPQGTFASRVVGVANYEGTGVTGVEQWYDEQIKGITGTLRAERDGSLAQNPISIAPQEIVEPEDGMDVKLTIDSAIQKMAEDELQRILIEREPASASILIMDPNTGEVLAMASASATKPPFDPNNFAAYSLDDINNNPVVREVVEPGSTFKAIMVGIGLQTGAFTTTTTVEDDGLTMRYGAPISNWNKKPNGIITPGQMLYYSSNVGAAAFADMIGEQDFYKYLKLFGYGEKTGIDLGGEESGTVKWPGTKAYTPLELSTNSFGQGISVTMLQHLSAYGALANGGMLMWPHVVREICDGDQCTPVEPRVVRRVLDQRASDALRPLMGHNTERYAGAFWNKYGGLKHVDQPLVPGYRTGAKTGTSQIASPNGGYEPGIGVASAAGWAPLDQPRVTILVNVDRPNPEKGFYGSDVAIPSFQRLASRIMVHYRIPPDMSYVGPGQEVTGPPLPVLAPNPSPKVSPPAGNAEPVPTPTQPALP